MFLFDNAGMDCAVHGAAKMTQHLNSDHASSFKKVHPFGFHIN